MSTILFTTGSSRTLCLGSSDERTMRNRFCLDAAFCLLAFNVCASFSDILEIFLAIASSREAREKNKENNEVILFNRKYQSFYE